MAWPLIALSPWLAAAWVPPAPRREEPCAAAGAHAGRQQLTGDVTGVATVDVSADGRIIAFVSLARLAPGDGNAVDDVYTLDRDSGRITLESATARGVAGTGSSQQPRLSGDARVLVYATMAGNLAGRPTDVPQVLRRDRATGATTLVSRTPAGAAGNGWSGNADVSDDGRWIVFESQATDLAPPDANHGGSDIYLFDAADGSIRRVSVADTGRQTASGQSWTPALSGDGRVVAFTSTAPLDAAARARPDDPIRSIFVRDLARGETRRISATRGGGVPDGASFHPAISGDGRRTVFVSTATDLDGAGRRGRQHQLFLHDAGRPHLRLVSRNPAGAPADGWSRYPALSRDGRFVVFSSDAADLSCAADCGARADLNLVSDVYRLELATGAADRVSGGAGPRDAWWTASGGAAVDGTGRVVAFSSRQPLDESDMEHDDDLYVAVLPVTAGDPGASGGLPCGPPPRRLGF